MSVFNVGVFLPSNSVDAHTHDVVDKVELGWDICQFISLILSRDNRTDRTAENVSKNCETARFIVPVILF